MRDYLWNKLNKAVFNMVADDILSEEEGESILDESMDADDLLIMDIAHRNNITLTEEDD